MQTDNRHTVNPPAKARSQSLYRNSMRLGSRKTWFHSSGFTVGRVYAIERTSLLREGPRWPKWTRWPSIGDSLKTSPMWIWLSYADGELANYFDVSNRSSPGALL